MANFFQKSCCNISRLCFYSRNLAISKARLNYLLSPRLLLNSFVSKRDIHLERTFDNLFTSGVGQRQHCLKRIHTTRTSSGIEDFFPPGVLETQQPLPEEVKTGRSWRAAELRLKSNGDLHKLWYILLKERNMLLTVQEEAKRREVIMPSPERLHKVKKSMAMIKVVLNERRRAIEAIEDDYEKVGKNIVEKMSDNSQGGKDKVLDKEAEIDQLSVLT